MDDTNITGTTEERLQMPWRFDSQGRRLSGPRGIEEPDEYAARVRKDAAAETENQARWDRWNDSLPEGKELTDEEIAAMIAADEGTVREEAAGVEPALEPEPEKKEFRAGNRTDEELANILFGKRRK